MGIFFLRSAIIDRASKKNAQMGDSNSNVVIPKGDKQCAVVCKQTGHWTNPGSPPFEILFGE